MIYPICRACGVQFDACAQPPATCPICQDERQFVPASGQAWTTPDALVRSHTNTFRQHESGLIGIGTVPHFAIGQRALLLRAPGGNILWDCISLLDDATIEIVEALGGLAAIAISHPHYYGCMVDWARVFDAPIHLHADDCQWIMRPDPAVRLWQGESLEIGDGLTLLRCGGHFAGGATLHWAQGAAGRGALLSGDILQVAPDRKHVSFMRSYPNMIPVSAPAVEHILATLAPYPIESVYGAFFDRTIKSDGKAAIARSAKRYLAAIHGDGSAERR
ncbi:MAG TPA: MBL fold metallo-hydrolase [Beijerinckiaceae bacterium]|nr:MBL fold metallo-hydrolase [Beijerinckiaceae bacterium]HVB89639.1 MBL fold metallo-hydrolase [Beijerinckiaceae bacterium]